jgi:hypothetical protein
MTNTNQPLQWLPGILIVAGLFFLIAGWQSDGPDLVGGLVFGSVSLAAAAAILYRRARDARAARSDGNNP